MVPAAALPPALATFLAREEQARLAGFVRATRRLQWLGGRLVAKHALGRLLPSEACSPARIVITPGASGEPLLCSGLWGNVSPLVSISHGGAYALALAACEPPCGVDIQQVVPTLLRVRHRFCNVDEEAMLAQTLTGLNESERLGLLWSAKEAGKKALFPARAGIAFLRLVAVVPDPPGWRLHLADEEGDVRVVLHGRLLNDHCLAWTGEERRVKGEG
ncbi:MAG: hypothetical protein BWK76_25825 [Desulfobulbaceae bacterium A2]|nr:MAG: hypothetical protein BWK76_25825 [Desulfobulbaceae bacterium A2]